MLILSMLDISWHLYKQSFLMFMPNKVNARNLSITIVSLIYPDDLVEKRMSEITIHDVDALALTLLVDFAYTGELVVCEENVQVGK